MRVKPKKRLGQNFLADANIRRKIISVCEFGPDDLVLEIGAGQGEMTGLIAKQVMQVYALELDQGLCEVLKTNLGYIKNVEVINQDVLKFDFKSFLKAIKVKITVFGNIPYYITTPIIERLLENKEKIKIVYLTVQKEFAQRVIADPGSKQYGSLSCFLQYFTRPKIKFIINKGSFWPRPKVDSCLLELQMRPEPAIKVNDEEQFFKIIRSSFNQRRKTLRNSLKEVVSRQTLDLFFQKYKIKENIRPEQLSLSEFAGLANMV